MAETERLAVIRRAERVAYVAVPATGGGDPVIMRAKGFTNWTTNRSAQEYTRQYIDESFETTDVVGITTSISINLDAIKDNDLHEYIENIFDNELLGDDAVIETYIVDYTQPGPGTNQYMCRKRLFSVLPSSEGGGTEAYTYQAELRAKGPTVKGWATTAGEDSDLVNTITFTPAA